MSVNTGDELQIDHEDQCIMTSLESYLMMWRKEKDDILRNMYSDKIKKLLAERGDDIDMDQALILCRNNRFDEGLIELYTKEKLYHLVLQYYIDQDDSLKIMKTCQDFGAEDARLYMPALIHYAKTGDERLNQLLKIIEHKGALPSMVVIETLLDSKRANLGLVRDYFARYLEKLNDRNVDNDNAIDYYKDVSEIIRQKIEQVQSLLIISPASKCSACQELLTSEYVHFLCNHSFHQDCFQKYNENDECPICMATNKKLVEEINSHETSKSFVGGLTGQFFTSHDDVFNNLAKLFRYGLIK